MQANLKTTQKETMLTSFRKSLLDYVITAISLNTLREMNKNVDENCQTDKCEGYYRQELPKGRGIIWIMMMTAQR